MVALEAPGLPRPDFDNPRKTGSPADDVNRGAELYRKGDIEGALAVYDAALVVTPDSADLRRTRALLLGELGRYEEAISDFDYLLAPQPRNPDLLLLKGMALYQLGRFYESLEHCEEGSRISPRDPNLLAMRGYALEALGRDREALEAFERALSIKANPHVAEARKTVLDQRLLELAGQGLGVWSGRRARGSKNPVPITAGPPVSDYVVQDRR